MSVYMSVSHQNFSNRYSCSFSLILTKLGTHDLCANIQKKCGTDIQNFALKFFGKLFKFALSLCSRLHLHLVPGCHLQT